MQVVSKIGTDINSNSDSFDFLIQGVLISFIQ